MTLSRATIVLVLVAIAALPLSCGGGDEEDVSGGSEETVTSSPAPENTPPPASPAPGGCAAVPETPPPANPQQYDAPQQVTDPARQYLAHVYTTKGHLIVELLPQIAPQHVNSFVFLSREGFYNGLTFHRIVPGFVAQGGDPTGTGSGGPGYTVPLEPSQEPFARGVVGMARANDPNSAGSQWFITLGDAPHLNGAYTVFGRVVQGLEFADCLQQGDAIIKIDIQEI